MRIYKKNNWKTTIKTQYNHFKYQVIPFGPSNTSTTFLDYINDILAIKLHVFVIVYLNDILIDRDNTRPGHNKPVP